MIFRDISRPYICASRSPSRCSSASVSGAAAVTYATCWSRRSAAGSTSRVSEPIEAPPAEAGQGQLGQAHRGRLRLAVEQAVRPARPGAARQPRSPPSAAASSGEPSTTWPKRNSSSSTSPRSPARSALASSASTPSRSKPSSSSADARPAAADQHCEQAQRSVADLAVEHRAQQRRAVLAGAGRVGQRPAQPRLAGEQLPDREHVIRRGGQRLRGRRSARTQPARQPRRRTTPDWRPASAPRRRQAR